MSKILARALTDKSFSSLYSFSKSFIGFADCELLDRLLFNTRISIVLSVLGQK